MVYRNWPAILIWLGICLAISAPFAALKWWAFPIIFTILVGVLAVVMTLKHWGFEALDADQALVFTDLFGRQSYKWGGWVIWVPGLWRPKYYPYIDCSRRIVDGLPKLVVETSDGIPATVEVTFEVQVRNVAKSAIDINYEDLDDLTWRRLQEAAIRAGGMFEFEPLYTGQPLSDGRHFTDVINKDNDFKDAITSIMGAEVTVNRVDVSGPESIVKALEAKLANRRQAEAELAKAEVQVEIAKQGALAAAHQKDASIEASKAAAERLRLLAEQGVSGPMVFLAETAAVAMKELPKNMTVVVAPGGGDLVKAAGVIGSLLGKSPDPTAPTPRPTRPATTTPSTTTTTEPPAGDEPAE